MSMSEMGRALGARMMTTALAGRASNDEHGQTTAEYALVLLGVAAVALALTTWAGGGRIAFERRAHVGHDALGQLGRRSTLRKQHDDEKP